MISSRHVVVFNRDSLVNAFHSTEPAEHVEVASLRGKEANDCDES